MSNLEKKAQNLSPGSVWESLRGSRFTVIAVSNIAVATDENASKRKRELFPLSVVFLNEENDVFSCNAESFLKAYEFVYQDDVVDSYISQVYAANIGELGPVDRKKIEKEQKKSVAAKTEDAETSLAQQMLGAKYSIKFIPTSEKNPILTSESLAQALTSYSVNLDSTGTRFYKFVFATNHVVNHSTLNATFNPEVYGDEENTYQKFMIESDLGVKDEIAWNTYCGLSLEIINQESFIALTLADIAESSEEVKEESKVASFEEELSRIQGSNVVNPETETIEPEPETEEVSNVETSEEPEKLDEIDEIDEIEDIEEVKPEQVQEELPTEAPIELVEDVKEVQTSQTEENESEDLDLDNEDDIVTGSFPNLSSSADVLEKEQNKEDEPEESAMIGASEDTPHTMRDQLASALAKQILSNQNK